MRLIVDTQGAHLHKAGERLQVKVKSEIRESIPINVLEQVVLSGRGVNASTALLYDLVRRGIDVVYQNQGQRFAFRLVGPVTKHNALRVQQVQVCTDPARALPLARATIAGKLQNQAVILRRYGAARHPRGAQSLRQLKTQVAQARQASNAESLRGYEGSGAAAYFAVWPLLFDAQLWGFNGRAYHPPPDPVNAVLSFGYTLLLNDVIGAVYRIGLDPGIGFFHTLDYGRSSLALDLEEEFRPVIVDTLVLHLLRKQVLYPQDFTQGPGIKLSDDARQLFLTQYEARLATRVQHPALGKRYTLRQCIQQQAEHLARCIAGRDTAYIPLTLR